MFHPNRLFPLSPSAPRPLGPSRRGFTLMEVLVAIGVFALGAVAVASIFPTAIFLQKQTIADVELRQFGYNVEGTLQGKSVRFQDAPGGFKQRYDSRNAPAAAPADPIPQVEPLNISEYPPSLGENLLADYSLRDRTYPANLDILEAKSVFVPLIYDSDDAPDAEAWVLYAFVLEKQPGASYPTPTAATPGWASADGPGFPSVQLVNLTGPPAVGPGGLVSEFNLPPLTVDTFKLVPQVQVMDNNGVTYRIASVTGNSIIVEGFIPGTPAPATGLWIGHPGTANRNPTQRILVFADEDPRLNPAPPAAGPYFHVVP